MTIKLVLPAKSGLTLSRIQQYINNSKPWVEKVEFKPSPLDETNLFFTALGKVPFLTGVLHSTKIGGGAVNDIMRAQKQLAHSANIIKSAGQGLQFAAVGVAGIDFLRIPVIYLAAFVLGEKVPFTLSKNAQWAYAAALLGLTLTAAIVPATAIPIAIAATSLSLAVSTYALGYHFYHRYQLKKEAAQIAVDITAETAQLEYQQQQLDIALNDLQSDINVEQDFEKFHQKMAEIDQITSAINVKKEQIQSLYDKKLVTDSKLAARGTMAAVDKGVTVALSALMLAGIIVSFFFPPAGLGIVAGSAFIAAAYIGGRVAFPYLQQFSKWAKGKLSAHKQEISQIQENESKELSPVTRPHESTRSTMQMLSGQHHDLATELKKQIEYPHSVEDLDNKLMAAVQHESALKLMLPFFKNMSTWVSTFQPPFNTLDCNEFLDSLNAFPAAAPLLNKAIKAYTQHQIHFSEEDKAEFKSFKPMFNALQEKGVLVQLLYKEEESSSSNSELLQETDTEENEPAPRVD